MNAKDKTDALLVECGATLTRAKKHEVWLLPNGQKFTRAKTPSDYRAEDRQLSDLKHALGIVKIAATNGERRVKKTTTIKAEPKTKYAQPVNSEFANKLRVAGVSENALKDENAILQEGIAALQTRNEELLRRNTELAAETGSCWLCRFRRWRARK